MSIADASAQARLAARSRWGSRVPDRAAEVVIERFDELDAATRARLEERVAAADVPQDGDDR